MWVHSASTASHVSSSSAHGSTEVLQSVTPTQPPTHVHTKAATSSVHVPPFKQGADTHSSMFTPQLSPVNPRLQLHQYTAAATSTVVAVESKHTPCTHGPDQHSSMSSTQFTPAKPAAHSQV